MKTTKRLEIIEKVAEFARIRTEKKALEKAESDLKASIKEFMDGEPALQAGDFLILVTERSRTDLDKAALKAALGDEIKQFEKTTTFEIMEVKAA